jgi:hypothetical protein
VKTIWQNPEVIAQTQLIARSFKHWTGRNLLSAGAPVGDPARSPLARQAAGPETGVSGAELAEQVFLAPFALVSHGTEADPVLNYGNQSALALWDMSWAELTRTPSRRTAEAPNREERARLLAAVTANGFIDNYSGIRIAKTGRRFRIAQAIVWNLLDEANRYAGQAAMFENWRFL